MNILDVVDAASLRKDIPQFRAGDELKISVRVIEGSKSRLQIFQGIVMRRQGDGVRETFTMRKISYGVGVERTFPVHTPVIEKIELVKKGDVRRAQPAGRSNREPDFADFNPGGIGRFIGPFIKDERRFDPHESQLGRLPRRQAGEAGREGGQGIDHGHDGASALLGGAHRHPIPPLDPPLARIAPCHRVGAFEDHRRDSRDPQFGHLLNHEFGQVALQGAHDKMQTNRAFRKGGHRRADLDHHPVFFNRPDDGHILFARIKHPQLVAFS